MGLLGLLIFIPVAYLSIWSDQRKERRNKAGSKVRSVDARSV